jgi:hypothetical protein
VSKAVLKTVPQVEDGSTITVYAVTEACAAAAASNP